MIQENDSWLPSKKDIEDYSLLQKMLNAQRSEFDILSKKKPDDQLNNLKIKMLNRVLQPLKELLKNEQSCIFLDILDENDLPTNSDVVLIISQYEKALINFRERYFLVDNLTTDPYGRGTHRWSTKENPVLKIGNNDGDEEENEEEISL